jgi:tetratricopeptide (TPR) repeat protein
LSFFNQIDINDKKAEVYLNLATIYQGQHQYQTALRFLNKSLGIQKSTGSLLAIYQCYRVMSEVYKVLGNETKSLYYLEKYVSLNDAQATLQTSKKIAELSELYHSEQRDRLISIQADNLEKQLREKELAQTKVENISLRNDLQKYIIVGFFILIVFIVIVGFNRHQRRMIQQKSKDIEMAQTLLRTQMNPHFIFNAMSVIQSYIYENDVKNSSKFLVSFSRLMRLILENSPKEFISIETEIEILTKYLETQKLRFEDRFEYVLTCSDELHFQKATIPPMITQPFIENAIEHGQLHAIEGGKIEINFSKNENMLHITITDNGVGRKAAEKSQKIKSHTSMALKITQQRIENLNLKYKSSGFIRIRDLNVEDETGTSVLISIPYEKEEIDQMA